MHAYHHIILTHTRVYKNANADKNEKDTLLLQTLTQTKRHITTANADTNGKDTLLHISAVSSSAQRRCAVKTHLHTKQTNKQQIITTTHFSSLAVSAASPCDKTATTAAVAPLRASFACSRLQRKREWCIYCETFGVYVATKAAMAPMFASFARNSLQAKKTK
jgi:hypothetical protein